MNISRARLAVETEPGRSSFESRHFGPGPRDSASSAELGGSESPPAAISANLASAGKDLDPVRFMILPRWFSTVRRLMPRSAAMFLLG